MSVWCDSGRKYVWYEIAKNLRSLLHTYSGLGGSKGRRREKGRGRASENVPQIRTHTITHNYT